MSKRRHSAVWHRLICLFMALHVLNFSVDSPDRYSTLTVQGEQQEDLSINDIESLTEFVLEECLGIVNAVPEHDEPDEEVGQTMLAQYYIFTQPFRLLPPIRSAYRLPANFIPFHPVPVSTHVPEITSPPPQRLV